MFDVFKQPRSSKLAMPTTVVKQTLKVNTSDRLSRDGSVQDSKKSRNSNQTEVKKKGAASKTQFSFVEETKLHENANLIFSSRKTSTKQPTRKSNLK